MKNYKKLKDWIPSTDKKIKYYLGVAKYNTNFHFKKKEHSGNLQIDLDKVGVMASVTLNGKHIGNTWIAPHTINLHEALLDEENKLGIEVVNVWRNCLTGDKKSGKHTTTNKVLDQHSRKERLVSSGLIGSVTIKKANHLN